VNPLSEFIYLIHLNKFRLLKSCVFNPQPIKARTNWSICVHQTSLLESAISIRMLTRQVLGRYNSD